MENTVKSLLNAHDLRVTDPRQKIVGIFLNYDRAISYQDIKTQLPDSFDRVTIYRTLKAFEDKGLIHSISDSTGELSYGLCERTVDHQHHQDHIHFKCTGCQKIECINDHFSIGIELPDNYTRENADILIKGICPDCQ